MINYAELLRTELADDLTYGVLKINGKSHCVTLERPDLDNAPNFSCIPAGHYVCKRVNSPRFGITFEIVDVPDRSHILLHPGNVAADSRGCVLLGRHYGELRGDRAVLSSGKAFDRFMAAAEGVDEFPIYVKEAA